MKRYLTHLAQIRILGEQTWCAYLAHEVFDGWIPIDNSKAEEFASQSIDSIELCAYYLNLKLNSSLSSGGESGGGGGAF